MLGVSAPSHAAQHPQPSTGLNKGHGDATSGPRKDRGVGSRCRHRRPPHPQSPGELGAERSPRGPSMSHRITATVRAAERLAGGNALSPVVPT